MGVVIDISTLKKVVTRQIHPSLIKTRDGGKNTKLSYVSGAAVVDMVNEAANYLKSWEIIKSWKEESEPTKYNGNETPQSPVAHVHGRLTIHVPLPDGNFLQLISDGFGSQPVRGGQSEQEHIFKSAARDAFKVAASYFGVALELYRDDVEQAIFEAFNVDSPWTEETRGEHQEKLDYIQKMQEEYGWTQEQLDEIVRQFSNNTIENSDGIIPDNIDSFVQWMKQSLGTEGKAS